TWFGVYLGRVDLGGRPGLLVNDKATITGAGHSGLSAGRSRRLLRISSSDNSLPGHSSLAQLCVSQCYSRRRTHVFFFSGDSGISLSIVSRQGCSRDRSHRTDACIRLASLRVDDSGIPRGKSLPQPALWL